MTLPEDISGIVLIDVNDVGYYANVTNGKGNIMLRDVANGNYSVNARFLGNDKYGPVKNSTSFTVNEKTTPTININVDIPENSTSGSVNVDLPENATGNVTVIIDGNKTVVVPVINGSAKVPVENLTPGNHTVEVIYSGDDNYDPVTNSTIVNVPKISDYPMKVIAEDIVSGDNADITVELPSDVNGVVLLDIDGVGYYVNVTDGVAKFNLPLNLKEGEYTVVATFLGDDKYASKKNDTSFNVKENGTPIDIEVKGDEIVINLPENATGNVTVDIDGNKTVVPVINGTAKVPTGNLTPGNHTVVVDYSGDDNYGPANKTVDVTVPKVAPEMNVTSDDNKIIVTLPEDATGNVTVVVDGKNYTVPVVNGTAVVPGINGGNHSVEVIYSGDEKYDSAVYNDTLYVNGIVISTSDVVKYYHGPERVVVNIVDKNGKGIESKEVKITINGITYTKTTNATGDASLAINLRPGNYSAFVEVSEYSFTQNINVEVKSTIYASDVVKVWHNGTQYWALFLDGEGNPLVNTTVSYNINGVFYNRTTNASGWCRLNINLQRGEYILTAINPVTGEMKSNNITVLDKLGMFDFTKYYRNESQYVARVLNDDGSYAGAGEEVTFNINGVFYKCVTNSTGHVVLNINLAPGDYIVTGYYKDYSVGNAIHVLPVLSAEDLSMKYLDGSKFTAKVLDGQGKPYAGQVVTFNINGVFYNRTSDGNGEAKLSIDLQPGEYVITSTYNEAGISNKITVSA